MDSIDDSSGQDVHNDNGTTEGQETLSDIDFKYRIIRALNTLDTLDKYYLKQIN